MPTSVPQAILKDLRDDYNFISNKNYIVMGKENDAASLYASEHRANILFNDQIYVFLPMKGINSPTLPLTLYREIDMVFLEIDFNKSYDEQFNYGNIFNLRAKQFIDYVPSIEALSGANSQYNWPFSTVATKPFWQGFYEDNLNVNFGDNYLNDNIDSNFIENLPKELPTSFNANGYLSMFFSNDNEATTLVVKKGTKYYYQIFDGILTGEVENYLIGYTPKILNEFDFNTADENGSIIQENNILKCTDTYEIWVTGSNIDFTNCDCDPSVISQLQQDLQDAEDTCASNQYRSDFEANLFIWYDNNRVIFPNLNNYDFNDLYNFLLNLVTSSYQINRVNIERDVDDFNNDTVFEDMFFFDISIWDELEIILNDYQNGLIAQEQACDDIQVIQTLLDNALLGCENYIACINGQLEINRITPKVKIKSYDSDSIEYWTKKGSYINLPLVWRKDIVKNNRIDSYNANNITSKYDEFDISDNVELSDLLPKYKQAEYFNRQTKSFNLFTIQLKFNQSNFLIEELNDSYSIFYNKLPVYPKSSNRTSREGYTNRFTINLEFIDS